MSASTTLPPPPPLPLTTSQPYYTRFSLKSSVLSIVDDLVVVLCIFVAGLVTFLVSRRQSQEFRSVFLADRSFHFIPVACSIFMSSLGTSNFVRVAGAASRSGLSVYAYELNGVIALLILGWIFLPVYIASGSITTVEYLRKRYGGKRMELYLSSVSIFLIIFSKIAVELFSLYRLVQILYGSVPWLVACLLPLLVSIFITCSGGLKTVIKCNTVHAVLLVLGTLCIARYSLKHFDDFDTLKDKYFGAWPNTTLLHFNMVDDNYTYTNCGIPKARAWNVFRPYANQELPWPGMIFGITINSLWYFCCDQVTLQSALGARDIVQAKFAVVLCSYAKLLTLIFLVLPGIVARILYTDLVACADPDICKRACGSRQGCSDMAFPVLFLDVVPQGYRGLVLAALLCCGVSSLCSSLNSGSAIFTLNIYRNFRPVMTETEILLVTRMSVIAIGVVSLMVVPIVIASGVLHDYILNITASFAPPILAVSVYGLLWQRANEEAAVRALGVGLFLAMVRLFWRLPYSSRVCGDMSGEPVPQIISNFHSLHFSTFLFVLCSAIIGVTSSFSEPTSDVHLYRLVYWLRHSKLDRVDLDELNEAYQMLKEEQEATDEGTHIRSEEADTTSTAAKPVTAVVSASVDPGKARKTAEADEDEEQSQEESMPERTENETGGRGWLLNNLVFLCCIPEDMTDRLVTKNELRETVKQRADIQESPVRESTLNLHAMMLLLVTAVLWGFLA